MTLLNGKLNIFIYEFENVVRLTIDVSHKQRNYNFIIIDILQQISDVL